jgi:hypothetical protein
VGDDICRFYPLFCLHLITPSISILQMRFDAWYIRQVSRRHAAWVYYIEHSDSCIRTVQNNCFAAGAAIEQIMYFITLCGDTE